MTFLIQIREMIPGKYANSPKQLGWRDLGTFNGDGPQEAICKAFAQTGCDEPLKNLRVNGVSSEVREK